MMALVGVEHGAFLFGPDALTTRPPPLFPFRARRADHSTTSIINYKGSIRIIGNGASRRRTRTASFRVRRVDHLHTKEMLLQTLQLFFFFFFFFFYRSICIIDNGASRHRTRNARFRARRADHFFFIREVYAS